MPTNIPFSFEATYVGRSEPSEFKRDGQTIAVPAKVKFLVPRGPQDGQDVQLMEVSGAALDRCTPPFDYASLSPGDRVHLAGDAVVQDRGSDRDSYVAVRHAQLAQAKVTPVAKAS